MNDIIYSYDNIKEDINKMLGEPIDFSASQNLLELGLSSLQIMRLANVWRRKGVRITFVDLISKPYLDKWYELINKNKISIDSKNQLNEKKQNNKNIEYIEEEFSLTDVQYAYWIGREKHQILGGVGCHGYLEIDGRNVIPEKLEDAWNILISHHLMLRVKYTSNGKQKIIKEPEKRRIVIHNLKDLTEDIISLELEKIRKRMAHRLLDIKNGKVTGMEISILPDNNTRIHFDIDLLVADVQSFQIILRDLVAIYNRNQMPKAPKNWSFGRYLKKFEKEQLVTKNEAKKYWDSILDTLQGPPSLPLGKKPEEIEDVKFKRHEYFLNKSYWEGIKRKSAGYGLTPAMIFLTAYAKIIERWSSNDKFLMNIPLFNRDCLDKELENVVADFTNLLLIQMDFTNEESFISSAKKIQEQFHNNMKYSAYSGVAIQRDLAKLHKEQKNFAPVVFSCNLGEPLINNEFRDIFGEITYMISQTPQVWIDLQIFNYEDGVLLIWDSVEDLFPKNMLDDMFNRFTLLLEQLGAYDDIWNGTSHLIPEKQIKIRDEINKKNSLQLGDNLYTSFFKYASISPDKIGVIDTNTGKQYTYGELLNDTLKVANYLRKQGIKEKMAVGMTMERGVDQIIAIMAIVSIGGHYVPVAADQPIVRQNVMYKKANVKHLLINKKLEGSEYLDSSIKILDIEEGKKEKRLPISQINEIDNSNLAYIIFTSGSTGEPKGIEITHFNALNTITDIINRYDIEENDIILNVSSVAFDLSVFDIFGLLSVGGTVVLIKEESYRDAEKWVKLINKYNITLWNSVPALLDMLLLMAESKHINMPTIRLALLSGDWIGLNLPKKLKEIAVNSSMVSLGGATEASIWSNHYEVTLPIPDEWKSIPYGKPLTNQKFRVVDKQGRDCPDYVAGELWIGGDGVARGYVNEEQLTKNSFVMWGGERWYKTGDLGRYLSDGNIEFLGREDFQVKIRGHRIELTEIEIAINKFHNIKDSVVIPINNLNGKYLVSFLVLGNKDLTLDTKKLLDYLEDKLPHYMVPTSFKIIPKMPITSNGKVDIKSLTQMNIEEDDVKECILPKTPLEISLAKIWSEILQVDRVSTLDNYFALGGDSLLATRLSVLVSEKLNVRLSLEEIFTRPVFEKQILYIEKALDNNDIEETYQENKELVKYIEINDKMRYEPFPLTEIQQAYLIGRSGLYTLGNVSTHYYYELEGSTIDIRKLENALNVLIRYHDMLRAVIIPEEHKQVILEKVPDYHIKTTDLRGASNINKKLDEIREEISHTTLSIDKWPLFDINATYYDDKIRLHMNFDNIIFDGWSISLFMEQLKNLYADMDFKLPEIHLSFRDYVLALQKIKETSLYENDKNYWLNEIKIMPPAPEIPIKNSPDFLESARFNHYESILVSDRWNRIKSIGKKENITPSAILLTAFSEVIGRFSKTQNFTINLTRFNRLPVHDRINDIIGDFTSLVMLSVDRTNGITFLERCKNIQKKLWQNLDHPYFCGVEVQREYSKLGYKDNSSPIMPIVFTSGLGISLEGDQVSKDFPKIKYNMSETPQVWLDHQVAEKEGNLYLFWDVIDRIFPDGLVNEIMSAYEKLLADLAVNKDMWTDNTCNLISILDQSRIEANNTKAPLATETLISLFLKQVKEHPDYIATINDEKTLTYKEVFLYAYEIKRYIEEKNIDNKSLIAIVMNKGWEQIPAVLGVMMAKAAYLPIDSSNSVDRMRVILKEADTNIILTQSVLYKELDIEGTIKLSIDEVVISDETIDDYIDETKPNDLAYVIYTSGSTGVPKGVVIDHKSAVNTILDINKRFNIGHNDRTIALSNLNFDLSVYDIFGMLSCGGAVIIPESTKAKEPDYWIDLLDENNITVWNTVPAFMQMLIEYDYDNKLINNTNLRLVLLSGDWIPLNLPSKIKARFENAVVAGLGGATEASIWSNIFMVEDINDKWKSIPYGKPLTNQRYHILNELMEDCPNWVEGRLYIAGEGLARGYWNDEEKTKERFIYHSEKGERLYYTGDMARYFPDGNIEFLGREDLQVKINGYRVELGEIESAISGIDGIRDSVVTLMDSKDLGVGYLIANIIIEDDNRIYDEVKVESVDDLYHWNELSKYITSIDSNIKTPNYHRILDEFRKFTDYASIYGICRAFFEAGIFNEAFKEYTIDEIMERAGYIDRYKTLINSWLDMLIDESIIYIKDNKYYCDSMILVKIPIKPNAGYIKSNEDIYTKALDLINKIRRDIKTYNMILRGEIEPLELLLEEKEVFLTPEYLNRYNLTTDYNKKLMLNVFDKLLKNHSNDKKVKVLEIGSRASNITKDLVEGFGTNIEYTYSDESNFFLNKKKESLKDISIEYRLFDMNKSAREQDYEDERYHIIIADNCLHRADNIEKTVKYLNDMIEPGGYLLFVEPTENNKLILNTTAFFEDGYKDLMDERKEIKLPFLSASRWIELLKDSSYKRVYNMDNFFIAEAKDTYYSFNQERIKELLSHKLTDYMIPKKFVVLDRFPLSNNGKIDRAKIKEMNEKSNMTFMGEKRYPTNDREKEIARIWCNILKYDEIGIDDNFFELGGDSLLAIQVINVFKEENINIALKDIFDNPTIELLTSFIDKELSKDDEEYEEGEI
ncbi:non-ribosomal peptide synthetase [Vallitalea sp.]|jgi:yersiniabactin nonribosomal peptide synthetase|uniref:non-ribosomal peptide synthetase n=1 Tax=Vallitalea sp. TaxID=1882829 RepID=UPI0025E7BE57|nr:non-ribosomal peptide synthetase [Vallitalea sp.]MCT4687856.1 amino acid adenylation domain-containing protein [Vallitalea sp.]